MSWCERKAGAGLLAARASQNRWTKPLIGRQAGCMAVRARYHGHKVLGVPLKLGQQPLCERCAAPVRPMLTCVAMLRSSPPAGGHATQARRVRCQQRQGRNRARGAAYSGQKQMIPRIGRPAAALLALVLVATCLAGAHAARWAGVRACSMHAGRGGSRLTCELRQPRNERVSSGQSA